MILQGIKHPISYIGAWSPPSCLPPFLFLGPVLRSQGRGRPCCVSVSCSVHPAPSTGSLSSVWGPLLPSPPSPLSSPTIPLCACSAAMPSSASVFSTTPPLFPCSSLSPSVYLLFGGVGMENLTHPFFGPKAAEEVRCGSKGNYGCTAHTRACVLMANECPPNRGLWCLCLCLNKQPSSG